MNTDNILFIVNQSNGNHQGKLWQIANMTIDKPYGVFRSGEGVTGHPDHIVYPNSWYSFHLQGVDNE